MKKSILFIGLLLVFSYSCNENENDDSSESINQQEENLRADFLLGKNLSEIKDAYQSLDSSQKIGLWSEKLNQLLNQDLSQRHSILISTLLKQLNNQDNSVNFEDIQNIAVQLAEITPESDFVKMFASLDDYNYSGSFKDEVMAINNLDLSQPMSLATKTIFSSSAKSPDCNCRWTCGNGADTNCVPTANGCGFLWLFSCFEHE